MTKTIEEWRIDAQVGGFRVRTTELTGDLIAVLTGDTLWLDAAPRRSGHEIVKAVVAELALLALDVPTDYTATVDLIGPRVWTRETPHLGISLEAVLDNLGAEGLRWLEEQVVARRKGAA